MITGSVFVWKIITPKPRATFLHTNDIWFAAEFAVNNHTQEFWFMIYKLLQCLPSDFVDIYME